MRTSLQFKLLVAFMLVITVTLGSALWGISLFFKGQMLAVKQQELLQKGLEIAENIPAIPDDANNRLSLRNYLSQADQYLDARIWVLDHSRQVVAMTGRGMMQNRLHGQGPGLGPQLPMSGLRSLLPELDLVYNGRVLTKTMDQPYYGEKMVVVAVPIKEAAGNVSGIVVLNAPVTGINAFMQRIYYYVIAGGLAALLLAFFVAKGLTRAIVQPLQAMEQATTRLAEGDYAIRVPVTSKDEVGRLGYAFNRMAQALADYMAEVEKTERLRRDFVANVSHELRTPLTIMHSYTEALLDGTVTDPAQTTRYLGTIQEETVRLGRLVKDLLDLSRLQSDTAPWQVDTLPLPAIAASVLAMVQPAAAKKNIALHLEAAENIPPITGNGDRLTQLLLVFLDNAIKHTPPQGSVTVAVTHSPSGEVVLSVQDTGAGIAAEDLPYIWDRFYKADKSHRRSEESGAGLGLAIAKQIIDRHNATGQVASQPGQGAKFTVTFPAPS